MTRRYTPLAPLCLLAASLTACDAAPGSTQATSSAVEPEAEAEPETDIDSPEEEAEEEAEEEVDVDCEPAPVVRPRLMFVLDKSSSMTNSGPETGFAADDGGPTRWAQLHALVAGLADGMESEVLTGAVLFPTTYAETAREAVCDVRSVPDAAIGPYRAADLMALLPPADAERFLGGSPAQAAYATALDHLDGLGGAVPTAIVLITDGGLNCADELAPLDTVDDGLTELVAFARDSLQIQTFVIGVGVAPGGQKVPNGDPDAALREIALAGGAAHGDHGYFSVAETQPLVQALGAFVERARADAAATICE